MSVQELANFGIERNQKNAWVKVGVHIFFKHLGATSKFCQKGDTKYVSY
jgi:hypothetical protein